MTPTFLPLHKNLTTLLISSLLLSHSFNSSHPSLLADIGRCQVQFYLRAFPFTNRKYRVYKCSSIDFFIDFLIPVDLCSNLKVFPDHPHLQFQPCFPTFHIILPCFIFLWNIYHHLIYSMFCYLFLFWLSPQ